MLRFVTIPVLYLKILVDVDIDHRDDDKRQQELDRARVHSEPASVKVKNRILITSSIFPLYSYLLNMVLYNIEKGIQRLRTDLVHHSFTRENAKVKSRDPWCKWYGLAHPVNVLDLQYLAYRRKAEGHLFILQTVLMYKIVMGNLKLHMYWGVSIVH
jgi:hypothetical protein